jgi:hypothetical protein
MSKPFEERFMQAIRRLGKTEAERAARLGYTVRAVDYWAEGKGLAATLKNLETLGIIRVVDNEDQPNESIAA